jgi:hypothetical protein
MNVPYRNEEESDKINEYLVSFGLLYCLILLRGIPLFLVAITD